VFSITAKRTVNIWSIWAMVALQQVMVKNKNKKPRQVGALKFY
jgi:hypothetical protein